MACERWREMVSARLDGEDDAARVPDLSAEIVTALPRKSRYARATRRLAPALFVARPRGLRCASSPASAGH